MCVDVDAMTHMEQKTLVQKKSFAHSRNYQCKNEQCVDGDTPWWGSESKLKKQKAFTEHSGGQNDWKNLNCNSLQSTDLACNSLQSTDLACNSLQSTDLACNSLQSTDLAWDSD